MSRVLVPDSCRGECPRCKTLYGGRIGGADYHEAEDQARAVLLKAREAAGGRYHRRHPDGDTARAAKIAAAEEADRAFHEKRLRGEKP